MVGRRYDDDLSPLQSVLCEFELNSSLNDACFAYLSKLTVPSGQLIPAQFFMMRFGSFELSLHYNEPNSGENTRKIDQLVL